MIQSCRALVLLACVLATTSCGIKERFASPSGFRIRGWFGMVSDLDAAVMDDRTIVIGWVANDQAWTRTLRLDGHPGPARMAREKAWQVQVVPENGSYRTLVLASGRLYLADRSGKHSAPLLPEDSLLVGDIDAIPSEAGPLCVSTAQRRGMSERPDVINFLAADASSSVIPLFDVLSVPKNLRCPPHISIDGKGIVVRVLAPRPDSTDPGGLQTPEGIGWGASGEPWQVLRAPEVDSLTGEKYKTRAEQWVLEVRGTRTASGWAWIRSPDRRFADPGPDRVRLPPQTFSCVRQRDLAMLVDWGRSLEWVRWPGDSTIARHVRIAPGTADVYGRQKMDTVQWPDSTAVLAWIDKDRERSSPEWNTSITSSGYSVGDVHLALASPDGSLRRLSLTGLPTMANACALRVLHAGDQTIVVWVKSVSAPQFLDFLGRSVSIEACAIPDARLRAQPSVPFD